MRGCPKPRCVEARNDRKAVVGDELELARLGVIAVLHAQGLDVVAETHSGRELASVAALEQPDLVVVGQPADLSVADTVRRVLRVRPRPVVALIALGSRRRRRHVDRARRARDRVAFGKRRRVERRVRVGAQGRAVRRPVAASGVGRNRAPAPARRPDPRAPQHASARCSRASRRADRTGRSRQRSR